jgi:hypothetical protein
MGARMNAPATLAWYFSTADKRLRYEDNREIALGVTHEVTGDIALCERGLHAQRPAARRSAIRARSGDLARETIGRRAGR